MYKLTDKTIRLLNKRYIRLFLRAKTLLSFDELNVLMFAERLYAELEEATETAFLNLAVSVYRSHTSKSSDFINGQWLEDLLCEYDPITKYVYLNEVERKRSRFAEALIISDDKNGEIKRALKLFSDMMKQYALTVTDKAVIEAYRAEGVQKVVWITQEDEKRCAECMKRHGKVYEIDRLPPKPHYGCRCYYIPYREEKK